MRACICACMCVYVNICVCECVYIYVHACIQSVLPLSMPCTISWPVVRSTTSLRQDSL